MLGFYPLTISSIVAFTLSKHTFTLETPPDGYILSCSDSQCSKCNVGNDGGSQGGSAWGINMPYPTCSIFSATTFTGAESKTGSGYDVYWDIGQPHPTCQIIIMSPVGQDQTGGNCGNVILAEKNAGCYYTNIQDTFMVQYCCGTGDCASATGGGHKRDIQDVDTLMARAAAGDLGDETYAFTLVKDGMQANGTFDLREKRVTQAARSLDASSALSLTARAAKYASALEPRKTVKCNAPTNSGDGYTKAGNQTEITPTLNCNSNQECTQNVGGSVAVAHTAINQQSFTTTTSSGGSTQVDFGVDFLVDAKMTNSVTFDLSQGIEKSIGELDGETVTHTFSQTYGQPPGTTGYVWFTPTLNCQLQNVVCGSNTISLEKCDPALLADGTPQGDMGFETTF